MIASDTLKHYFLEELRALRTDSGRFAEDYPVAAGQLRLNSAPSQDPHVELLLQSFAYLTGQLRYSMDCQDAELPGQLMQALNPALACPTPSMAVVQLEVEAASGNFEALNCLPRGTELSGQGRWGGKAESCTFTTLEAAELWPLEVLSTEAVALNELPQESIPAAAQSALSVRIRANGLSLFEMPIERLRFALTGDQRFGLYDAFSRDVVAVATTPGDRRSLTRLGASALECCVQGASLLRDTESAVHPGLALLREYFACPERFLFFSVNGLSTAGHTQELELIFFLSCKCPALSGEQLRLNCVPMANLYRQRAEPINLRAGCVHYPLQGDRLRNSTCEVHSVRELSLLDSEGQERVMAPLYADQANAEIFWTLRREVSQLPSAPGIQTHVAFVNRDFVPTVPVGGTVGGAVWCTNRRLAESLSVGDRLRVSGAGCVNQGLLATAPSPHQAPPLSGEGAQRLCALLSDYCLPLSGGVGSLAQLKQVLRQHCQSNNAAALQQIDGLQAILHQRIAERTGQEVWHGLTTGVELTLRVELAKYAESSALLFGEVLNECFASFAPLNSFVKLLMNDIGGEQLKSWPLRTGTEWT